MTPNMDPKSLKCLRENVGRVRRLKESKNKEVIVTMRLRDGTKQTKKYSNEEFKKRSINNTKG